MNIEELIPWLLGAGSFVFGIGIFLCTTIPFVVIFGGLGYYLYRKSKNASLERQASQAWRRTRGVIVKSRVEVSGGDTTTVSPRVVYEYEVGARRFVSEQVRAGERHFSMRSSRDAYDTVDRYPVGAEVTVYYDPQDPARAALER